MPYESADALIVAADNLYEQKQYLEAANLLEAHWLNFPDEKSMLVHWIMCMNVLDGQHHKAVEYFKLLIDGGLWFPPGFLQDSDFDPLREIEAFRRLEAISLERYAVAQQNAKPELFIEAASDEPLPTIIMCHGDGDNATKQQTALGRCC